MLAKHETQVDSTYSGDRLYLGLAFEGDFQVSNTRDLLVRA